MNLQSTDFELFGLPARFALDDAALHAQWQALQRQVHPDRFATASAAEQRMAAQWSARINEAYRRLKDPLKRAAYLCELNGAPIDAENNTAMPAAFLMRQMELREQADEAATHAEFDALQGQADAMRADMLQELQRQADTERRWADAAQTVRALMFLQRLLLDVERKRAALD